MKLWKVGAVVLAVSMTMGCGTLVDTNRVASAIEKQGYRDVKIVSKHIIFVTFSIGLRVLPLITIRERGHLSFILCSCLMALAASTISFT